MATAAAESDVRYRPHEGRAAGVGRGGARRTAHPSWASCVEQLGPVLAHMDGAEPAEYYVLAERYGITINDDWIEDIESTYGVKL